VLVTGDNEDSIVTVVDGSVDRLLKVLSDVLEVEGCVELGSATWRLSDERPAVGFARTSICKLTAAFSNTVGIALAVDTTEEEVGIPLAGRLSALMMSAAFNIASARSKSFMG